MFVALAWTGSGTYRQPVLGQGEAVSLSPGSLSSHPWRHDWDRLLGALLTHKAPLCKLEKGSPYLSDATLAWQADRASAN